jgi:hypothetical protein
MAGGDLGKRRFPPASDRASLGGVEIAVKPVRRPPDRRVIRAGRQDAQIAIGLQAVGIDDRASERRRQFERQRRFAARCRPGDQDDGGQAACPCSSRLLRFARNDAEKWPSLRGAQRRSNLGAPFEAVQEIAR